MPSVKQGGIKYHFFKVFGMTQPGIEPWSLWPLAISKIVFKNLLSLYLYIYTVTTCQNEDLRAIGAPVKITSFWLDNQHEKD